MPATPPERHLPGPGPARLRPGRHRRARRLPGRPRRQHLYSAPLLTATPGSAARLRRGRPTRPSTRSSAARTAARQRLAGALRDTQLGLVVDIVPNHVGVAVPAANPAWWDVLRRRARLGVRGLVRHRLGPGPAAAAGARRRRRPPSTTSRSSTASCATTSTASRSPPAPATAPPGRCTTGSTTSWSPGGAATPSSTTAGSSPSPTWPGLRVEDPAVFDATHAEILRWAAAGEVDGIRVDHPDGLRDPAGYLRPAARAAAPDAWLVVEKILEHGEELPDWPVDGTTGYDALAEVGGLFVDPAAEGDVHRARHPAHRRSTTAWEDLTHTTKLAAATRLLAAELTRLAALAPEVPTEQARAALAELAAAFAVYRGYLPHGARAPRRRPLRGRPPPPRPGRRRWTRSPAAAQPRRRAGACGSSSSPAR